MILSMCGDNEVRLDVTDQLAFSKAPYAIEVKNIGDTQVTIYGFMMFSNFSRLRMTLMALRYIWKGKPPITVFGAPASFRPTPYVDKAQ